jgi:hypothetical protein
MALFFELGIFGLALAFGFWQLRDVAKAREETAAAKRLAAQAEEPTDALKNSAEASASRTTQAASKDDASGTAN